MNGGLWRWAPSNHLFDNRFLAAGVHIARVSAKLSAFGATRRAAHGTHLTHAGVSAEPPNSLDWRLGGRREDRREDLRGLRHGRSPWDRVDNRRPEVLRFTPPAAHDAPPWIQGKLNEHLRHHAFKLRSCDGCAHRQQCPARLPPHFGKAICDGEPLQLTHKQRDRNSHGVMLGARWGSESANEHFFGTERVSKDFIKERKREQKLTWHAARHTPWPRHPFFGHSGLHEEPPSSVPPNSKIAGITCSTIRRNHWRTGRSRTMALRHVCRGSPIAFGVRPPLQSYGRCQIFGVRNALHPSSTRGLCMGTPGPGEHIPIMIAFCRAAHSVCTLPPAASTDIPQDKKTLLSVEYRHAPGLLRSGRALRGSRWGGQYRHTTDLINSLGTRLFHATRRREWIPPFIVCALAFLKSSTALSFAHTVTRVAMTLVPITILKVKWLSKLVRKIPTDIPQWQHKVEHLNKHIRMSSIGLRILFLIPTVLFFATVFASIERTPLTGRWRLILLSPDEEEEVSRQLKGPGWYDAVAEILRSSSTDGHMPRVIPLSDWRYAWVEETLRRLESYIPIFQSEQEVHQNWFEAADPDFPVPPPTRYPLVPRPRAAQLLHCMVSEPSGAAQPEEPPHVLLGPPYTLLLVEKPESSNAFSYGFGANGGGGIVVFTGFLDEILKRLPAPPKDAPANGVLGGLFTRLGRTSARPESHPVPTEEQTAQLAVLLAHELSHLLLSHHLETLSSSTIVGPSVLSIFSDVLRTLLFPVTMLFGPFVNDALASVSKATTGEIAQRGWACHNRKLEIEADVVSARLLAYAGFDPRIAIQFWESRMNNARAIEPTMPPGSVAPAGHAMHGTESGHPLREERIKRLKQELARWEALRLKTDTSKK